MEIQGRTHQHKVSEATRIPEKYSTDDTGDPKGQNETSERRAPTAQSERRAPTAQSVREPEGAR